MKRHLNLLPLEYRRSRLIRRRVREWLLILGVSLLVATSWLGVRLQRQQAAASGLASLERQYAPLKIAAKRSAAMRRQIDELAARKQMLSRLVDNRPALTLLSLVAQAAGTDGQIYVRTLSLRTLDSEPLAASPLPAPAPASAPDSPAPRAGGVAASTATTAAPPPSQPKRQLTLEGVGIDNLAVARFVLALRESKAFDRVELKSTAELRNERGILSTYLLECTY